MTEQEQQPAEVAETPSIGEQLKQAREAAGLSQQALANKLFLKLEIIQQIETDSVSDNTSATFVKGYIRLYAKNVGVDAEPLIKTFEQSANGKKGPQKLQSFSRRVSNEATDSRWMMVTYLIITVVIALSVWWWYQQSNSAENETTSNSLLDSLVNAGQTTAVEETDSLAVSEELPALPIEQEDSGSALEPASDQRELATELTSPAENPEYPDELPSSADIASAEASPSMTTELSLPTEDDVANELPAEVDVVELVFTFADDCWVNITDVTGEAIAYGTKVRGRVMAISGVAPFEVTLGAPQNVSITYAGEPVDMSDIPAGRSARFNLPK